MEAVSSFIFKGMYRTAQSFEGLRSKYRGVLILTKPFGKPVKDFIQISEGRGHRVTVFIVCYLLNAMGYFTEAREP